MDKDLQKMIADLESDVLNRFDQLNLKQEKVGYVFDEKMLLHKDFTNGHPEKPERVMAVYMNLVLKGISEKLVRLRSEEATEEDILRVHDRDYLRRVQMLVMEPDDKTKNRKKRENLFQFTVDTYDNYYTFEAALMSAGCLLSCCKSVMKGEVDHAFAIIRPPGHHAGADQGKGFCFFNNVAIAADFLIKVHGKKVVVLDWDVHHGDGTQQIFYKRDNPLQISVHRHDMGKFYPYTTGKAQEIGEGEGKGFNLNIPWNALLFSQTANSSIGDSEYAYVFDTTIIPVIKEFKPDVILVSCGFDAAEEDPLGKMSVTPVGYAYMTHQLKKVCKNVIFGLEGGYNVQSLSRCSEAVIRTLINDSQGLKGLLLNQEIDDFNLNALNVDRHLFSPSYYAVEQVNESKKVFEDYWNCLKDVKTVTPVKKFVRRDAQEVVGKICEISKDFDRYLITDSNTLINSDLLKFRIGKFTLPDKSKSDEEKWIRRTIKDNRTLSRKLQFRLEAIFLNKSRNERNFNWVKSDGIFDTSTKDISLLISKFLSSKKISKKDVMKSLELFRIYYEESFLQKKLDLFNVDLVLLPITTNQQIEGIQTRSSSRKSQMTTKTEISIKLNGIKEYSLQETKSAEEDANNFYQGILFLIKFIDDNIMG